ncbi:MAG: hypothetical protein RIS88_2250 [Pseudomonadota bacterium]|jgi:hypothetical protein
MDADEPPGQAAEAARYAVLRRIGPALRHDLIVNLQAVGMMTDVVAARIDRGLPPLAELQQHLARIQRGTREAIANSLRVATWLVPPEDDSISLRDGVLECLALVRSGLEFRGYAVRAELEETDFQVSSASLRPLVLAALLHLADHERAPGELAVSARLDPGHATLTLARTQTGPGAVREAADTEAPYRRMQTQDVLALARGAHADLRLEDPCIFIRLQRLVPTSPLQIAPV